MGWRERVVSVFFVAAASMWVMAGVLLAVLLHPRTHRPLETDFILLRIIGYLAAAGSILLVIASIVMSVLYLTRRWGRERTLHKVEIVSLFAIDHDGEMRFQTYGAESEMRGFYVKLRLPDGSLDEFECPFSLYRQLRQGAFGTAVCKGVQLVAFYGEEKVSGCL